MIDALGSAVHIAPDERSVAEHLSQMADALLRSNQSAHPGVQTLMRFSGLGHLVSPDAIFTGDTARQCVAKAHGYDSWEAVIEHDKPLDTAFEWLVDRMLLGDMAAITSALADNPAIVNQTSVYPHQSTLLHYTGSNGVEGYRQVVPSNLPEIVDVLLAAGSDAARLANLYGGSDARGLTETSKHPHEAGLIPALQRVYDKYTV